MYYNQNESEPMVKLIITTNLTKYSFMIFGIFETYDYLLYVIIIINSCPSWITPWINP